MVLLALLASPVAHAQVGTIQSVAGSGIGGYAGDGLPALTGQLYFPESIAVDVRGNLYIADSQNHRIRKVSRGVMTTVAGNGTAGDLGDNGPATAAQLKQPEGVAVDGMGNLYIADYGNHRIRKVTPGGRITTLAGNTKGYNGDNIPAKDAALRAPIGVTVDPAGNLYIADAEDFRIRKIDPNGIITTVAGNGTEGYSGDGGSAVNAQLNYPTDVVMDALGSLYIADSLNAVVRRVDAQGNISTYAGVGFEAYMGDNGPANLAALDDPTDLAVDTEGNLFIADSFNHVIRKVTPNGIITTVAGTGSEGYEGEGGIATAAMLNVPIGVDIDPAGNLYLADNENHRIRMIIGAAAPALTPGIYLPGSADVNRDGVVDINDALLALSHAVGQRTLNEVEQRIADLNADARIDIQDAVLILREAVGLA